MNIVRNFKLIYEDTKISGIDCKKGGCIWNEGLSTYIAPTLESWHNSERVFKGYRDLNGKTTLVEKNLPLQIICYSQELDEVQRILKESKKISEEINENAPAMLRVRDYSSGKYGHITVYTQLLAVPGLYQVKHVYTGDILFCEDCGIIFEDENEMLSHIGDENSVYVSMNTVMDIIEKTEISDELWLETKNKINRAGPPVNTYEKYIKLL